MPTPLFDIPTFTKHFLPPSYRLPKWMAAVQSFLYGLTWRYGIFRAYQAGDNQPGYNSATVYNTGNAVMYSLATYESAINNNTGNIPGHTPLFSQYTTYAAGNCVLLSDVYYVYTAATPSSGPFVPASWMAINGEPWLLRCGNFVGATERANINGRYLSLTWALNRQFGGNFRQPPYPAPYGDGTYWSDIYITNEPISFDSFLVNLTEAPPGYTGLTGSNYQVMLGTTTTAISPLKINVYIPDGIYASIATTAAASQSVVSAFLSKALPSGITWQIITY